MPSSSAVTANRAALTKFSRAMMKAIHYIKTDKEGNKAIYSKNLKLTDPEGLERAYQAYVSVFRKIPYPPGGVKTMLDDLAPRNPKAATADPKAFVDMSRFKKSKPQGSSNNCTNSSPARAGGLAENRLESVMAWYQTPSSTRT